MDVSDSTLQYPLYTFTIIVIEGAYSLFIVLASFN